MPPLTHACRRSSVALIALALSSASLAQVVTTATGSESDLAAALHPAGLAIVSVRVRNGDPVQIGTYANFSAAPITIPDGIVLASGSIAQLGPSADTQAPGYDPASPPAYLSADLGSGTTSEFTAYGETTGAIYNFTSVNDVASLEVTFDLPIPTNVKFDFVFGSVEYPAWTDLYTDSFVAFLDGTDPAAQVSYDPNGSAIQVGHSFAALVSTLDANTAFAAPHGLIRKLTTTTPVLSAGRHSLRFEVGDVNDGILDSAVFITNLRAQAGVEGTDEAGGGGCGSDLDGDDRVDGVDLGLLLGAWGDTTEHDLNGDDRVDGADLGIMLGNWGPCG